MCVCVVVVVVVVVVVCVCVCVCVQDVSYQCCIELTGERDDILTCLAPFFNPDTGI